MLAATGTPMSLVVPYVVSNVIGVVMLVFAWRTQRGTRIVLAAGFAIAAVVNGWTAVTSPERYLAFARTAIPPYPWLIEHAAQWLRWIVLVIALGQLGGAILLAFGGRTAARTGALVLVAFLVAIAPFGLGSAFPASLLMAAAVWKVGALPRSTRPI